MKNPAARLTQYMSKNLLRLSGIIALCLTLALTFGAGLYFFSGNAKSALNGDYLSPELRARVSKLVEEARTIPTTQANVKERAGALWEWSNAYSLTGGTLSVDYPAFTAIAMSRSPESVPPALDLPTVIQNFIEQLALLDRDPTILGALEADPAGPFVSAGFYTITQTYTVGSAGLQPGGGFVLGRQREGDHGVLQTTDPKGENYLAVTASRAASRFVADGARLLSGVFGDLAKPDMSLFLRLEGEALQPHDTVTITYGDTSGGSRGFQVQSYSNDEAPLPLFVAFDAKKNFFMLPLQNFLVVGGEIKGLHGFAPSIVGVNEAFTLSVRAEDKYRNRASGKIPSIDVFLNGAPFRKIEPGKRAITLLNNIRFSKPGIYRFSFVSADGRVRGEANPVLVEANPTTRIYWGDLHGHSGFSEAQGSAEGFFRYGREDARLDFLAHTEHDLFMDANEWNILRKNAVLYNKEGEFITFLSYEWSQLNQWGGHHNVFFRTPENRELVPLHTAPTLETLYKGLRAKNNTNDVLIIPHAHEAGDWRLSDSDMERLVEVASDHGSFEWFGRAYLASGFQMGFIGAGDNHDGHPGYSVFRADHHRQTNGMAALMADKKTSQALFDAMRNRQTYATSGARIILKASVNGALMGARTEFSPQREIKASVIGTAFITDIAVIRNGVPVYVMDYQAKSGENEGEVYELSFTTPSMPVGMKRANPRMWVDWGGEIKVEGAKLIGVEGPDFINTRLHRLERSEQTPNVVRFQTYTRGSISAIRLTLAEITPATKIIVTFMPKKAGQGAEARVRQTSAMATQIPAQSVSFLIADANAGSALWEYEKPAQGAPSPEASMWLRPVTATLPLEADITYRESDQLTLNDSYYLRVRQSDGMTAWSSPVWVGGP